MIVFIYNSFNDPLFQNLVYQYILTQTEKHSIVFHLITFEQPEYHIPASKKEEIKSLLKKKGIIWYPLSFHTGRLLLLKKLYDLINAIFLVLSIRLRHQTKAIFAFANVAAAYSIIFAKLFRMKLIIYSYEPHSEFMAELGIWSRRSLKFKILNWLEHQAGMHADYIMTGTKFMVDRLLKVGSNAKVFRAPTAVDPDDFYFRPEGRKRIRNQLKINDRKVVLYIGKFGDLYYRHEIIDVFKGINQAIPEAFFIVVTKYDHKEIRLWFEERGISTDNYYLTSDLTNEEVKEYISAADIGISGVPPTPSQKFRSPTKVAEYLLCGLPYITARGVSEDDLVAEKDGVGVVLDEFNMFYLEQNLVRIRKLLDVPNDQRRNEIRKEGLEYRSRERIDSYLGLICNEYSYG